MCIHIYIYTWETFHGHGWLHGYAEVLFSSTGKLSRVVTRHGSAAWGWNHNAWKVPKELHRSDRAGCGHPRKTILGMDQYLYIAFLVGWTSIYQLFWCSPGVQGFDTLPYWADPTDIGVADFCLLLWRKETGKFIRISISINWPAACLDHVGSVHILCRLTPIFHVMPVEEILSFVCYSTSWFHSKFSNFWRHPKTYSTPGF